MVADMTVAYDAWYKLYDVALDEARRKYPPTDRSPEGIFAVGDALFGRSNFVEALATYRRAPINGKVATQAQNRIALCMLKLGHTHEAEMLTTGMISGGSADNATHAVLGLVYLMEKKYSRARSEVETPMQHGSLSCQVIAAQADIALRDFRRAVEELKLVDSRAEFIEVPYLASGIYTDVRNFKFASDNLFNALSLDPGNLDVYTQRGFQLAALAPTDPFVQAGVIFDFVLARNPKHPGALMGKAIILIQQKKYSQAEPLLRDLVKEDKSSADALVALAAVWANGSNQNRTMEALATARKFEPDNFNDIIVPKMAEFVSRVARYRRPPMLTPALLSVEENGK